jgi:hypothetical protein
LLIALSPCLNQTLTVQIRRQLNYIVPVGYSNLVSVIKLLGVMLLTAHWAACIWYYLSYELPGKVFTVPLLPNTAHRAQQSAGTEGSTCPAWALPPGLCCPCVLCVSLAAGGWPWVFSMQCSTCPDLEKYTFAFYRSFLVMLGDRPTTYNNVERIFVIVLLFAGACLYAIVVSSFAERANLHLLY